MCTKTWYAVWIAGTLSTFFENKTGWLSQKLFNLTLQKVIQSMKMVPSGIKTFKE
jgi:hypothetical protein